MVPPNIYSVASPLNLPRHKQKRCAACIFFSLSPHSLLLLARDKRGPFKLDFKKKLIPCKGTNWSTVMALASTVDFYCVDRLQNHMPNHEKIPSPLSYEHLTMKIHPVEQLETEWQQFLFSLEQKRQKKRKTIWWFSTRSESAELKLRSDAG